MHSLWLKLLAAFALVILLGAATNALLISRATSGQFNRFVTANSQEWTQQMVPALADHYARTGNWEGVEPFLRSPWQGMMGGARAETSSQGQTSDAPGMQGMMGSGMMSSGMMGPEMMGSDMWRGMGVRLLLADGKGTVVADTATELTGTILTPAEMAQGMPVVVDGQTVGVLVAVTAVADATSPASAYLTAVNRATWLSGLLAAGLALLSGVFLFRQIVAPVRAVTTAAQAIAAGDLEQRVPVTSQDEIGQMAMTFNQMADALVADQRLRRTMMADIAHELRTPISVIQANLEAMLDGVLPAEPQEIALLHDETLLLARLVADLRLLSLAEAGQLKLERTPANMGELICRSVDQLRVQAEANQVALIVDLQPNLPLVEIDKNRIEQVFGNLLSNALRYTPTGGRITVRAKSQTWEGLPPAILVEVADTGKGIDSKDLPFIFDRFYRADKSRNRASGGTGIGLALVKQLVEAHGGRVWAESMLGAGTTIAFAIPQARPTTA